MLTDLLPGLRELRTPLASGYVLLAALWLGAHEIVERWLTSDALGQHVASTWNHVGPTASLAATTFVAYLAGALWSETVPKAVTYALGKMLRPFRGLLARYCVAYARFRPAWLDETIERISRIPVAQSAPFGLTAVRYAKLENLVISRLQRAFEERADFRDEFLAYVLAEQVDTARVAPHVVQRVVDIRQHILEVISGLDDIPARLLGRDSRCSCGAERVSFSIYWVAGFHCNLLSAAD